MAGVLQTSGGGTCNSDLFVAKPDGTGAGLDPATNLGGSSYQHGHGIAGDADGNAYVMGMDLPLHPDLGLLAECRGALLLQNDPPTHPPRLFCPIADLQTAINACPAPRRHSINS